MQKKLSKQNNSGFTLSEVLIAVAILIVLMGLAMIPITRHQRDLRQTELDAKAEIVYHAAQNKLSELLANGRISDCYAEDLQPLNNTPLDAAERKTSLHYVTSAAKTGEGSAAAAMRCRQRRWRWPATAPAAPVLSSPGSRPTTSTVQDTAPPPTARPQTMTSTPLPVR